MALYEQEVENEICWPAPLEGMYQLLGGGAASGVAPKLPHLGLADVLFMTLVMSLHNLELARATFPRLIGLRGGRIHFDQTH